MSGPFFTEGSYTKNTPEEVQTMMTQLEKWSTLTYSAGPLETLLPEERISRISHEESRIPLTAMEEPFELKRYMGKWHVQANIPTFVDKGTINNTEEYRWDEERQMVLISFKYASPIKARCEGENGDKAVESPGPVQEILQHGTLMNPQGTEWALKVKMLFYIPVPARYLVIAVDEGEESAGSGEKESTGGSTEDGGEGPRPYTSCMIGVPDRSSVWIMNRSKEPMSDEVLAAYALKATLLGYEDVSKLVRVPVIERMEAAGDDK